MRKIVLGLSSCLLVAACVTRYEQPPYVVAPPLPPAAMEPAPPPAAAVRECREFQQTLVVNGQEQPGYGKACRQPDGSWKIVQ